MANLAALLSDVDRRLERSSDGGRTLSRVTDLFVQGADSFDEPQIDLFDVVIGRILAVSETAARAELARRLGPGRASPRGVILALARDEIAVARWVLVVSPRLESHDLVAIALDRGRDHMLAICERAAVPPIVTDVLVHRGDGAVRHAVVGNAGASFSTIGYATLLECSRRDDALAARLGGRDDLSADQARQIVAIVEEARRDAVAAAMRGHASLGGASGLEAGPLACGEDDVARLAGDGRKAETLAALTVATALPTACLERIFAEPDNDLLLVICRAMGWSWRTAKLLLRLRAGQRRDRQSDLRAEETFDALRGATAQRVVHLLQVRESAMAGPQARTNVR